jgi:hypothetical protein
MGMTLGLYAAVEVIASQLVEPHLYGHTAGLSPLSVVVAAIFWGWLWGPIGLIVSTPLTLCLVVAGRNIAALRLLDILFGDSPSLTLSQKFYQRALSGDADEIIASAQIFLKRKSFAAYCDAVLVPALRLAVADLDTGQISASQRLAVQGAIVNVIETLGSESPGRFRRPHRISALDHPSLGRHLRHQRERLSGPWQGPLDVPLGSVVLCVGLGSLASELSAEILVRILRTEKMDSRHLTLEDFDSPTPEGGNPESVSLICLVSAEPGEERERAAGATTLLRNRFGNIHILKVFLPGRQRQHEAIDQEGGELDDSASSFVQALQKCLEWYRRAR